MRLRILFVVACCWASTVTAQDKVLISVPCNHLSETDCDAYSYVFHALGSYLVGEEHVAVGELTDTGCERQPTYSSTKACLDQAFFQTKPGQLRKPVLPSDVVAAIEFLIEPVRRGDGSVAGTWWLLPPHGGVTSSTFVLRPMEREGAPWILVDVPALPEALKLCGVTDEVKRRGGFLISETTKMYAHLAVRMP